MRQDSDSGRNQEPPRWQVPRQRVPYEESGSALDGRPAAAGWRPFSPPAADHASPSSQRSPRQQGDGQQLLPVADASAQGGLGLGDGTAYAISLALAVSAALVFFVSLADRQLNLVTVIVTVALMIAALASHWRLARQR
jgi:hypothetical protein